jgi:hypothetical protein
VIRSIVIAFRSASEVRTGWTDGDNEGCRAEVSEKRRRWNCSREGQGFIEDHTITVVGDDEAEVEDDPSNTTSDGDGQTTRRGNHHTDTTHKGDSKKFKNKDLIYKGGGTPPLLATDEGAGGRGEEGAKRRRCWKVRDLARWGVSPNWMGFHKANCYPLVFLCTSEYGSVWE